MEIPEKVIRETMAFLVAYGAGMGPKDAMMAQAEAIHDVLRAFVVKDGA